MYVKIINPKTNGRKVYANTGSAVRLTNYLSKEAKEEGKAATFFGPEEAGILSAAQVTALLDNNQKGLTKEADKFHSLVLSPSAEEIGLMGNDPAAMQRYTREVMELYAKNFNLKGGRELSEKDLVWAATIHQDRKNRGTYVGVQGEKKEDLQTHIHVVVSARDAQQQLTLNPQGKTDGFSRVVFQAQAGEQFEEQFGRTTPREIGTKEPSRPERVAQKVAEITGKATANREKKLRTPEQIVVKNARLSTQVARLNSKVVDQNLHLAPERVKEIAKERKYDNVFYITLGKIERNAEQGKFTSDPYGYLATGQVEKEASLKDPGSGRASGEFPS